jgi:peptide/nickel transport system permease protein
LGAISRQVINKVFQSTLTVFFIITFNFLLFRLLPGDPLRKLFRDPRIPQETIDTIAKSFGLDQPVWVQYFLYLKNLVTGNLGISFSFRQPVWDILSERLFNTVLLMLTANIIAVILGVMLGIYASKNHGKIQDTASMGIGLLFWSMPTFWIGMIVVVMFTGVLPISGMVEAGRVYNTTFEYIIDVSKHMILPVTTLALVILGQYAIIMRNALSTVMTEDYITTAKAKGFNRDTIYQKYAVPNAMLPLVTIIAVNIGFSVAGAIQAEIVFGWPGVGQLIYDSVINRDFPILQGAFLIISFTVVAANFIADIIYTLLDPRILSREG